MEKAGKKGNRPVALSAIIVKEVSQPRSVRGLATILAGESVELKSEITGRVQTVMFREGSYVERGALLVKLNDADLQANRAKALAKVDLLEATHTRKTQQLELQAISKQEWEQSAAELASQKADVSIIDAQIAKTEVRAPFSGRVGFNLTATGAVVSSGQILTKLVQVNPVKLEFSVPGEFADAAVPGKKVEFEFHGNKIAASIYAVEGSLEAGTRSLPVRARVDGKVSGAVPGTVVPFHLEGSPLQGMMVPPDALAGDSKGVVLYLLKDGKAVPKPVELGLRSAEFVQVLHGIKNGDTVLCVGASPVRPGAKVELLGFR